MSAVAAPYADLFPACPPLDGTLLDRLSEKQVTRLLTLRFQSFTAQGYDASAALLRAVGVNDESIPLVIHQGEPVVGRRRRAPPPNACQWTGARSPTCA